MFRHINKLLFTTILGCICTFTAVFAQPGFSFDLKKPEKYESRKLASERTDEKKFTIPRKFIQGTVTHYNYYFNANNKINEVIARAKDGFIDNYTKLLPFYNYSLDGTAMYKPDLDSVIYKSASGILLHDLRNSWIDNLYMLLGRAYYYRKTLDSAYLTFQFINFSFAPKEKDGYDKVIGSNSNEGTNAFSISTKENRNIFDKALSEPPSRNDALIWLIKTHIANDALPEAAGLIQVLKNDPQFPERLKTQLYEEQAHWFYKQEIYDSAAFYLEKALPNAENTQEQARWEYLLAQLHERSGNMALAKGFYAKCQKHTMNPVMEVYAMLNGISQNDGSEKAIPNALDELMKMAKKDRYYNYRDIIYYTASQIELKRNNPENAIIDLKKSIQYNTNNPIQKSRSYFELGNISYTQRKFIDARNFYDSVDVSGIDSSYLKNFNAKKSGLNDVVVHAKVIARQDSLQQIAAMSEMDREAYIKKTAKRLRKEQGLKEEEALGSNNKLISPIKDNNNAPLFGSTAPSGEWYFSNQGLKAKGFTAFKSKWGSRPNVDNWRRNAAINASNIQTQTVNNSSNVNANTLPDNEISYKTLLDKLPLTPEKLKLSNDSVEQAMYNMAMALQSSLENYPAAIDEYEKLLSRFPSTLYEADALFGLYYCYGKVNNKLKQDEIAARLNKQYPNTRYADIAAKKTLPISADSLQKLQATTDYNNIYNLFIEGHFNEAIAKKKIADSLHSSKYWNPQLMYIEAVYYVKEHNDSLAKITLSQMIGKYSGTPIGLKAQTLYDVVNRRKEIETYLTNLQIERPSADSIVIINDVPANKPVVQATTNPPVVQNQNNLLPTAPVTKIDSANKKTQPVVSTKNNKQKAPIDSSSIIKSPPVIASSIYSNKPNAPQLVALVLDKVDPVYFTEAKNAFSRYNRENYSSKNIELNNIALNDDIKLVLFKQFENATDALDYIDKAKKLAPVEIIPWLKNDKYSFILITEQNLQKLQQAKDIGAYKKFLADAFPGKF